MSEELITKLRKQVNDNNVIIAELRKQLIEQRKEEDAKSEEIGKLKTELMNSQKLSSVIFARWCLELFKNNILVKCCDEYPLKSSGKIKTAWKNFFNNPPADVKNIKDRMVIRITESEEIKEEVDKLNEKQRKGSFSEISTPIHWFKKRGQALYWKLSDILHDLSKLNWLNSAFLDTLTPMLPDFNPGDKVLLSIVHAEVKPFTSQSNIEESVVSF